MSTIGLRQDLSETIDPVDPVPDEDFGAKGLAGKSDVEKKFTLPQALADHFILHTKIHVSDPDMKMNLENYPLPANVSCVPKFDQNFNTQLEKESKATVIDSDNDWETIQQDMQDVMGPLGKPWSDCALYKKGVTQMCDVYTVAKDLEMASLALAHAMQKASWFRRVHSLGAMGTIKNVKETLEEEKVQGILNADLFIERRIHQTNSSTNSSSQGHRWP